MLPSAHTHCSTSPSSNDLSSNEHGGGSDDDDDDDDDDGASAEAAEDEEAEAEAVLEAAKFERSSTNTGTAPASTTALVCADSPDAMLVSAQAAQP